MSARIIRSASWGVGVLAALWLLGTPLRGGAQTLELLRQVRNSALVPPAGQGLDLLHGAEPLGKGRFRFTVRNRTQSVVVPDLGNGSAFTSTYSVAYGITPGLDASVVVPFLIDAAGGLNKYGSSDPVIGLKLSRPGRVPSSFYTAYQLLVGIPLGYKGEHALDKVGGVRRFSNESVDVGLQVLLDMNFRRASVYVNGGYFRSGNPEVLPEMVYGVGLELGRASRWLHFNAEYWARVAFAAESRAAGALKFGLRADVYRGIELQLNREFGLLDHPSRGLFTFGLRMHGHLTGRRRLEGRYTLYKPPPPPKRMYQPTEVLRIAVVDFGGYEDLHAGPRLVDKLRSRLEPHDSLEVVDLRRYADVPQAGFLKPQEALDLARRLGVDVVVTGEVRSYEVDRFAGPVVPFLVKLPQTRVRVELRYRVLEFSPDKTETQAFLDEVTGETTLHRRVRLLPADMRDITVASSARDLDDAQDRALNDVIGKMLAAMAGQFSWVPPDFLP